jgi:hypothetical protein
MVLYDCDTRKVFGKEEISQTEKGNSLLEFPSPQVTLRYLEEQGNTQRRYIGKQSSQDLSSV